MRAFTRMKAGLQLVAIGTLASGALTWKLPAQLPRMAPPPPCRIPARVVVPAINGVFREKANGITLAVLPIQGYLDAADRAHVAWALQNRVTFELARNERLRVPTEGSVARAIFE